MMSICIYVTVLMHTVYTISYLNSCTAYANYVYGVCSNCSSALLQPTIDLPRASADCERLRNLRADKPDEILLLLLSVAVALLLDVVVLSSVTVALTGTPLTLLLLLYVVCGVRTAAKKGDETAIC
jgi:hypothetical protein